MPVARRKDLWPNRVSRHTLRGQVQVISSLGKASDLGEASASDKQPRGSLPGDYSQYMSVYRHCESIGKVG